jgi:hypothetical protein
VKATLPLKISLLGALLLALGVGCSSTSFNGAAGGKVKDEKTKDPKDESDGDDDEDEDGITGDPSGQIGSTGSGSGTDTGGDIIVGGDAGVPEGSANIDVDEDNNDPIRIFADDFRGGYVVRKLEPNQRDFVWVGMSSGNVTYLVLDGNTVTTKKSWSNVVGGGGGTRTYVTEGGVVFVRTGGHAFWIDPLATPEGAINRNANNQNYWNLNTVPGVAAFGGGDRGCVVSYKRDKKRYIGIGYGAGHFIEFKLNDTPPYAPVWTATTNKAEAGGVSWGYSCFVDQERLIYYGTWYSNTAGQMQAVDLKTMQAVDPAAVAPNRAFASTNLTAETVGARDVANTGSYAMSGDRGGNILNGTSYYTMTHEAKSDTVWGSSGGTLKIFPRKCFSTEANCAGFAQYNMSSINVNVGPMSALGGGRVVGLARSAGTVYVMKLKNLNDPTQGVDATAVENLSGDPYMYTDFTGATLYLTETENTVELDTQLGFDATKGNKSIGFAWLNKKDKPAKWEDIKLEVRCYASTGAPGEYEAWAPVKDATQQTIILTDSCRGKAYNRVDVKLTQENGGDSLMGIAKFQVTVYQ